MSLSYKPYFEDLWDFWFREFHNGKVGMAYKVKDILYSGKSKFQKIEVLEVHEYGRMLILYGSVMLTEKDEFIYHEMITHVPVFVHENPKDILVIGGGDGCALRELLKHKEIKEIHLVEIDEKVIEISKKYLSNICQNSFNDSRVKIIPDDGFYYLKKSTQKYDLVISDAPDPLPPGDTLFKKDFFRLVKEHLKDKGIFVSQTESPFYHADIFKTTYKNLSSVFKTVQVYLAWIPTYPSALWSFMICSDFYDPLRDFKKDKYKKYLDAGFNTKYYNDKVHFASFALPNFVEEILGNET
ncbi:MAG: polyamine aminopropyltransferase [Deltaproteobacteria bacterium]|nr:polyamine aminopropyltransferase [Deltaproteobacteria bacterium]